MELIPKELQGLLNREALKQYFLALIKAGAITVKGRNHQGHIIVELRHADIDADKIIIKAPDLRAVVLGAVWAQKRDTNGTPTQTEGNRGDKDAESQGSDAQGRDAQVQGVKEHGAKVSEGGA